VKEEWKREKIIKVFDVIWLIGILITFNSKNFKNSNNLTNSNNF